MCSVHPWQGVRDGCKQVRRSGVRLVKRCGVRTSRMAALCGRGTMPNGRSIATIGQSVNGDSAEMAGSAPRVPAYGGCGFSVHMPYRIRRCYFRPGRNDRVGATCAGGWFDRNDRTGVLCAQRTAGRDLFLVSAELKPMVPIAPNPLCGFHELYPGAQSSGVRLARLASLGAQPAGDAKRSEPPGWRN